MKGAKQGKGPHRGEVHSKLLARFLERAADELEGDWVLLGGALLPALGIDYRVTTDIDFVSLRATTNRETLQLMRLAEDLGLAPEAINPAAAYFFQKIPEAERHLQKLREGRKGTIHRPDLELYVRLKAPRFMESDLDDCLQFLKWARKAGESFDARAIVAFLNRELRREERGGNLAKAERLKKLVAALKKARRAVAGGRA